MVRRTKEALHWIVGILRKQKVPFQITGGFAAKIYGSKRTLFDIDMEIPDSAIPEIYTIVSRNVTYGPKRYKDKQWDIQLMTLSYKGQLIDICGSESELIFSSYKRKWIKQRIDLDKAKLKNTYGMRIPIVTLKSLIYYKRLLNRRTDTQDIKAMLCAVSGR